MYTLYLQSTNDSNLQAGRRFLVLRTVRCYEGLSGRRLQFRRCNILHCEPMCTGAYLVGAKTTLPLVSELNTVRYSTDTVRVVPPLPSSDNSDTWSFTFTSLDAFWWCLHYKCNFVRLGYLYVETYFLELSDSLKFLFVLISWAGLPCHLQIYPSKMILCVL
jgi:hypothetical protein